jgi:hypothetical protein
VIHSPDETWALCSCIQARVATQAAANQHHRLTAAAAAAGSSITSINNLYDEVANLLPPQAPLL